MNIWTKNVRSFGLHDIIRRCNFNVHDVMARDDIRAAIKAGSCHIDGLLREVDILPKAGRYEADFNLQQGWVLEMGFYALDEAKKIRFINTEEMIDRYTAFQIASQTGALGSVDYLWPTLALAATHHSNGQFQIMDLGHPNFKMNPRDDRSPIIFMEAIRLSLQAAIDGEDVLFLAARSEMEFTSMVLDRASAEVLAELEAIPDLPQQVARANAGANTDRAVAPDTTGKVLTFKRPARHI